MILDFVISGWELAWIKVASHLLLQEVYKLCRLGYPSTLLFISSGSHSVITVYSDNVNYVWLSLAPWGIQIWTIYEPFFSYECVRNTLLPATASKSLSWYFSFVLYSLALSFYSFQIVAFPCRKRWDIVWGQMASWYRSSTQFKLCHSSNRLQAGISLIFFSCFVFMLIIVSSLQAAVLV